VLDENRVLRRYRDPAMDCEYEARVMQHVCAHGMRVPAVYDACGPDLVLERIDGMTIPGDAIVHLDLHPLNVLVGADGPVVIDWPNTRCGAAAARASPPGRQSLTPRARHRRGWLSHSSLGLRQQDVITMTVAAFAQERPRLVALATRILGSSADADDVVQEAWLRVSRTEGIDDLAAWLTTVVTRMCLDQLRRRSTRSAAEAAAASEPLATDRAPDPAEDALVADRVGDAMRVVFDTLAPAERAAFVLHDVFGYRFDEVAAILGRSETAARQLASRARRKVQGGPEAVAADVERADSRRVVDAFLTAARGGDLASLLSLLAPDAVMRADLVGQRMGTPAVFDGADAVAGRFNGARGAMPVLIDGQLGAAWIHRGTVKVAFVFHVEGSVVREVELIADPDVLATLDVTRIKTRTH
jgi:RNA polymerase sigma-70 factor (ECF subfamily)